MSMSSPDDIEKGESVTVERKKWISDHLDADEEPQFILKGKSVEIQRGDETDSKSGKRTVTAVTDERVLILVMQRISGNDTRSLEYGSVDGVNLDKGIVTKKMRIQLSGKTYRVHVLDDDDEIDAAMKYIRAKKKQATQSKSQSETTDPTEQLKNVKELHDQGVLTDEEFEEKKQELLEKI